MATIQLTPDQHAVLAQVKDRCRRRSCTRRRLYASVTYEDGIVCRASGLEHHTTTIGCEVLNRTGSSLRKTACANPKNGCNDNRR